MSQYGSARPLDVNYDEAGVPEYTLPDALLCRDGAPVSSPELWFERRRPELLDLFASQIYGRSPPAAPVSLATLSEEPHACGGIATRKELELCIRLASGSPALSARLLLWLPNAQPRSVPVFLGLNFFGNQSVSPDPDISLARGWVPNNEELGITEQVATEASRGAHARRWPVEMLLARGYALATLYAGDFEPDFAHGYGKGVRSLFAGPNARTSDAWGSVAAWAWGLSRALDALQFEDRIDGARVAVIGHSRFGKAALWAGASDARFALVISNNSGAGGAALARRCFGERVHHLNRRFPHWFCQNYRKYEHAEERLPVDQHELVALVAPRPVYVASAALDLWADPRGEYLACRAADSVSRLLGAEGFTGALLETGVGSSPGGSIGYHRRAGRHDITSVDWWHYLAFADRHFGARK
jgi:hypothetical protein